MNCALCRRFWLLIRRKNIKGGGCHPEAGLQRRSDQQAGRLCGRPDGQYHDTRTNRDISAGKPYIYGTFSSHHLRRHHHRMTGKRPRDNSPGLFSAHPTPAGVKATQFPRAGGGGLRPGYGEGIAWSGTHLIPRPALTHDKHPGPVRGGPPCLNASSNTP